MYLLIAAAAANAAVYPAQSVLAEYQAVCGAQRDGAADPIDQGVEIAKEFSTLAESSGWVEVKQVPPALRKIDYSDGKRNQANRFDFISSVSVNLLNYELASQNLFLGEEDLYSGKLFKKIVSGRTLYLSTFAFVGRSKALVECRLLDPFNHANFRTTIKRSDIATMANAKIVVTKGIYGSDDYSWNVGQLRLHFQNKKADPYALRGLAIVRSIFSKITVN